MLIVQSCTSAATLMRWLNRLMHVSCSRTIWRDERAREAVLRHTTCVGKGAEISLSICNLLAFPTRYPHQLILYLLLHHGYG